MSSESQTGNVSQAPDVTEALKEVHVQVPVLETHLTPRAERPPRHGLVGLATLAGQIVCHEAGIVSSHRTSRGLHLPTLM